MYSDQTEQQLSFTSYRGNRYIMVMVELDSSGNLVEGIKDRSTDKLPRAYLKLLERLEKAVVAPKKHIMDNEIYEGLRETIKKGIGNVSKVAIKMVKAPFIAIIAGLPKSFPPSICGASCCLRRN
ncbi:hypothetical protein ACHAWF_012705 [Thalassiosira exigua]